MNVTRLSLHRLLITGLVLLLASVAIAAQQTRGSLRGVITDELGAVIVGANVTLTDASGTQKKTTTNAEGVYTYAGLGVGWSIGWTKRRSDLYRRFYGRLSSLKGLNS